MTAAPRHLRIAQVAPPLELVPPKAYGGTERIVDELVHELIRRGHAVTVFASGDSDIPKPARHVPTVPRALRPAGSRDDVGAWFAATVNAVLDRQDEFDVIHSHLEWWSLPLVRGARIPVAATFHGRLDLPYSRQLLAGAREGIVAVSRHQASVHPDVPWTVVHNGLTLDHMPFGTERPDALCFVGRVDPEKGIVEAIEIACAVDRPLRIAAKIGHLGYQRAYYEDVFKPALRKAGSDVEFLGELAPADRDRLFAESYATLMPGAWPEPFGLVAIESLACGTPVVARRVGGLPEIIREGLDGVFGDDVREMAFLIDRLESVDRAAIRDRVVERFSAARMTDRYEELYARLVGRPLGAVERLRAGLAAAGAASPDLEPARGRAAAGPAEPATGVETRAAVEAARNRGLRRRPVAIPIGSSVPVGAPIGRSRNGD
ncbi:MAG TPA: glycosyltransferase family 4 protein [Candidatus Binatus sp.]|nr:glycosyltransferase family 4 protein [Candidatus Binatus sp.]